MANICEGCPYGTVFEVMEPALAAESVKLASSTSKIENLTTEARFQQISAETGLGSDHKFLTDDEISGIIDEHNEAMPEAERIQDALDSVLKTFDQDCDLSEGVSKAHNCPKFLNVMQVEAMLNLNQPE